MAYTNGPPTIVTDGLVLYLDAANPRSYVSGSTVWRDLSGEQFNGSISGSMTVDSSNLGSLSFNGTNTYVSVPYTPILAPTAQITFGAWAYLSNWDIATDCRILSKTQVGGYYIGLNDPSPGVDAGYVGAIIYVGGAYRRVRVLLNTLSSGWHNFMFTFDGRYFRMYLDGIEVNVYDHGSTSTITYSNSNHLVIGAEPSSGTFITAGFGWPGRISQVCMYNTTLSSNSVLRYFNAMRGRFGV